MPKLRARVDPRSRRPLYSAGFATPALWRRREKAPVAELVDALELKIEFRKECWFDSGQGHQKPVRHHSPTFVIHQEIQE